MYGSKSSHTRAGGSAGSRRSDDLGAAVTVPSALGGFGRGRHGDGSGIHRRHQLGHAVVEHLCERS